MSDYVIPDPEPKEIDERLAIELRHLAENAVLKGAPSGNEKCDNCLYYLENSAEISYCWHPKLRILVGSGLSGILCEWRGLRVLGLGGRDREDHCYGCKES